MTIKKTLYAVIVLLSCHGVRCMDYHDLYGEDTTFFEFIRTVQQEANPFSINSENAQPALPQEPLLEEPQPNQFMVEKRTFTDTPPSKRKRTQYLVACHLPDCTTTLKATSKLGLARTIALHLYSKKHNSDTFNAVKEHVKFNMRPSFGKTFEVACMHEKCNDIFKHKTLKDLTGMLINHLYATNKHNREEIEKFKNYIEECL